MSSKNYKPTMTRVVEARKEGQYVRAKSWGKKTKCPKAARRAGKKALMKY